MRKALTMAAGRAHWERTYTDRTVDQVSWYEPQPRRSLALIEATKLGHDAGILDVGGGASSLAARLVGLGYSDLTVADIAPAALAHARPRSAATRHASPGSRPTSAATISAVGMTCGTIVPTQCSGLPVERYGAEDVQRVLGDGFELLSSTLGDHRTPSGRSQQFHYAHLRQRANADAT